MRPYLAVIKDSFREAMASRVLWVLLSLITLELLLMAPIGYQLRLTTEFSALDLVDPQALVRELQRSAAETSPSPGKRIWSQWDEPTRAALEKFQALNQKPTRRRHDDDQQHAYYAGLETLRAGLNQLVHSPDFYQAEIWKKDSLPKEARDLIDRGPLALAPEELGRLNRILVETAFPSQFHYRGGESVSITYFGWFKTEPLPFGKQQVDAAIKDWILPNLTSVLVGWVAICTSILVTSSIIPQMFEPGSITLLFSKPISRSLLFLAKFVGGCAFILLNVGYLLVGWWLILGLRFGLWNSGLLYCIPVFLFLFLIYYSVSALAGVIWKNAVVSVVVTIMFWVSCTLVGGVKGWFDVALIHPRQIIRLVQAGETLLSVSESGDLAFWKGEDQEWQIVQNVRPGRGGNLVLAGPLFQAKHDQILLGVAARGPFGFGGDRLDFQLARPDDGWTLKSAPALPNNTDALLLDGADSLLVVSQGGIFRFRGELRSSDSGWKVLGIAVPLPSGGSFQPVFEASGANGAGFQPPLAAALNSSSGTISVYSRGVVTNYRPDSQGMFAAAGAFELPGDVAQGGLLASAGGGLLIAREDGRLTLVDAETLSPRAEFHPEPSSQPRFVAASPDGRFFAALFHNNRLWLIDAEKGRAALAPVAGQGDISAATFVKDQLYVADRVNRVTVYGGDTFTWQKQYSPRLTQFETAYYFSIKPLYDLFPKPSELDATITRLITNKSNINTSGADLQQRRIGFDPWAPVYHGLIFTALVLVGSCLYLERHEF